MSPRCSAEFFKGLVHEHHKIDRILRYLPQGARNVQKEDNVTQNQEKCFGNAT